MKFRARHKTVGKGVHSRVAELALGRPCAPVVTRHHCGSREAEATSLKNIPNHQLRDRGVGQNPSQDLSAVILSKCEVRATRVREVAEPLSLPLSDELLGVRIHCRRPGGSMQEQKRGGSCGMKCDGESVQSSRSQNSSSDCAPRLASMSAHSLPASPMWAAIQTKCVGAPLRQRYRSISSSMSTSTSTSTTLWRPALWHSVTVPVPTV
eukprot:3941027-Rhodomonas_salina.1